MRYEPFFYFLFPYPVFHFGVYFGVFREYKGGKGGEKGKLTQANRRETRLLRREKGIRVLLLMCRGG